MLEVVNLDAARSTALAVRRRDAALDAAQQALLGCTNAHQCVSPLKLELASSKTLANRAGRFYRA